MTIRERGKVQNITERGRERDKENKGGRENKQGREGKRKREEIEKLKEDKDI